MRIIHFSDFHLRADHLERAESIIKRLKETLRTISEERKIDLITFIFGRYVCVSETLCEIYSLIVTEKHDSLVI